MSVSMDAVKSVPERSQGQVEAHCDDLATVIDTTVRLVGLLEERLGTILDPSVTTNASGDKQPNTLVPLAEYIRSKCNLLSSANCGFESIIDRIQL